MKKTILLSFGLMMSCGSVAAWAQQNFPKMTVANDTVWYVLSTPERNNLHLTCAGEGDYVTGSAATYANSQMWCFVASPNGQLNMLNRQAGLYLSEKAAPTSTSAARIRRRKRASSCSWWRVRTFIT